MIAKLKEKISKDFKPFFLVSFTTLFSLKIGETNPSGKTWASLVSYVDDLTVGGRRNSQGEYDDPMSFPSFGHQKKPKIPQDCFPHQCYEQ